MSARKSCVLAIAPVSRGFGLFVLDSSDRPLDWRVKEIHAGAKQKNARCVFEVDKLIEQHRPQVLVLEDHRAPGSKKRQRISELLDALAELAINSGVGVATYGPREVRATFALPPSANKDIVAAEVAKRLPALRRRVPKVKAIWESERYPMPIFVAAAVALTHRSRAQHKDGPRQ